MFPSTEREPASYRGERRISSRSPGISRAVASWPLRAFQILAACLAFLSTSVHLGFGADPTPDAISKPKPLTQTPQIRALSRQEAGTGIPVKIKGVVTWQGMKDDSFTLADVGSGILVRRVGAQGNSVWEGGEFRKEDCEPGTMVEVEGITDAGGYAPHVLVRQFKATGTAPVKRGLTVESLATFSTLADGQRIKVSGVVQGLTPPTATASGSLNLSKQDRIIPVQIEQWEGINAEELLDATVRVEGIFAPSSNLRAEMLDLKIKIMGRDDIEMVTPPPDDPFDGPMVPLDQLHRYSQKANDAHRKVTHGIVSFCAPGQFFFIQEGMTGVRVQAPNTTVPVGERVQVAGFVDMSRLVASLNGALVRRLGQAAPPAPLRLTARQILDPSSVQPGEVENDCDGRLVRVRGRLLRVEMNNEHGPWHFEVTSGETSFPATLISIGETSTEITDAWVDGAEVELTGVCELTFVRRPDLETPAISAFRLWLRSPRDIRVLNTPSWWTSPRLTAALVVTALGLLAALAWVAALRRAVRVRTLRLEEVMRLHRDSELEFQAALQERQRLAADLHDGLQQMIAGATFRLEAAVDQLPDIPPEAQEELTAARRALLHTQTGLRDCLWGLRSVEEGPGDFAALLRHAVGANEHWPAGSVIVESRGEPFELSRNVMGNLLLLMQEACANAFQHGHATVIRVDLDYEPDGLQIRIDDDGIGFEPDAAVGTREGHFGLQGMRERMERLDGTLEISSAPGRGTRVRVHLSRAKVRARDTGSTRAPIDEAPALGG